jgi:hypothetical protein
VTIASLVIGGVVLAAIIAIAAYGWVTLPADARVPVHYGIGSYRNFASKTVGLIMWPVGGAVAFGILTALAAHAIKPNHGGPGKVPLIIVPVVLVIVAVSEWRAIKVARRNTGNGLQ